MPDNLLHVRDVHALDNGLRKHSLGYLRLRYKVTSFSVQGLRVLHGERFAYYLAYFLGGECRSPTLRLFQSFLSGHGAKFDVRC